MKTVYAVVKPFGDHPVGTHLDEATFENLHPEHKAHTVRIHIVENEQEAERKES